MTSKANGKAESSVRTVKHLFKEAERDGKDPLLALLDYGNNHTEGLGTSPIQRLMSRRTRNLLPTVGKSSPSRNNSRLYRAVRGERRKAKFYYDRTAK